MIVIWIVIALFAAGDTAASVAKDPAPSNVSATASVDAVPPGAAP
ncbi:MAG TPA: hypothetical protein VGV37_27185 [Aliidongia sp.]|nr:hypothetical protein [Aliidongia sp.]HEV2678242.1 hypothetical protein [Aliidongia sp.]